MSSSVVQNELKAFLNGHEPRVFVVKGRWGVGKTHLVRETFDSNYKKWGNRKHAFVSLFGVNSLTELRESIFVELVSDAPGTRQGKELLKQASEVASRTGEIFGGLGSSVGNLVSRWWMSQAIPGSKIVIDDVERRGDGLNIRDLLGFLSQLNEQFRCQVVLIFNEGELDGPTLEEIGRYREKVFDIEVSFVPAVKDVIRLGFPDAPLHLAEVLTRLGVDNIRALQRIREFVSRLQPYVEKFHEAAKRSVLESAVILGWFYYLQGGAEVPWDFVKNYEGGLISERRMNAMLGLNKPVTEEDKRREAYALRLQEAWYGGTGPIEKLLVQVLETGLYELEGLDVLLTELSKKVEMSEAQRRLTNEVWNIYHSSFDDTEQHFVNALTACFAADSANLSVNSLDSAITVLQDLGRKEVASELLQMYFDARPDLDPEHEWYELHHRSSSRVADKLREIMARKQVDTGGATVIEIIHKMIRHNGWDPRDAEILGSYSEEDWYRFFKEDLRKPQFEGQISAGSCGTSSGKVMAGFLGCRV